MVFHSTVLFVKDIESSKEFYTRFLNFSITYDFGKNVILSNGLSLWQIEPDHIINNKLETGNESNRFELYFETGNLETISDSLKSAGIQFLHTIHEESWGQRTIRFFDPDNHLVEIGESMDIFVNNMHKNGLTPMEISRKSGIPLEKVVGLIWK
ncbi:MAG: VOC family protein [Lentimicrobiaceae bacterium]|jgi:catechol 2,3-dioxygenase-like lactoylglutathione lyase family enzyme